MGMKKVFTNNNSPRLSHFYKLTLPEDTNIDLAVNDYGEDPFVEFAEPNYYMKACDVPNDPYYNSSGSWGQEYKDLYGLYLIHAADAWNLSVGDDNVVVAIIDTGIDYTHEDIADNMWINEDEILGNGIDDDNDSFIDNIYGADIVNNDGDPMDGSGHGTHCAGTITAIGNNTHGVVGVNWCTRIMAVKGLSDNNSGNSINLAEAIVWASDQGAKILSNSWASNKPVYQPSQTLIEAINYSYYEKGCIVVFAAGNSNNFVGLFSPQNMKETFTVAATDWNDQKAGFSNYGGEINVSAPGVNILSLRATGTDMYLGSYGYVPGSRFVPAFDPNAQYYRASGTSMACSHVAGLAALILSLVPDMSNAEVTEIIESTTDYIDDLNPGYEGWLGSGRINAYNAIFKTINDTYNHNVRIRYIKNPNHLKYNENGLINFNVSIVNVGKYNETNVTVRFFVNGTEEDNTTISSLEKYEHKEIKYTWTPPASGKYNITINITVPDLDEDYYGDNEKDKTILIGVYNINTGECFNTIQEAINDTDTTDGNIILIPPGIYYENVTVNKNISLLGKYGYNTIIDGNKFDVKVMQITNTNFVNITNIDIRNGKNGVYIDSSSNTVLTDIIILNNNGSGMYTELSNNLTLLNCKIYNNTEGSFFNSTINITLTASEIYNNNGPGIYLKSSNNNSITSCTIYNNTMGIFLNSTTNINITNCEIGNNSNGIYLNSVVNNSITNCLIHNNIWNGINITFYSNNNTFTENTIIQNNKSFIIDAYSQDNHIYHNNFINNIQNALDNCGNNQWDNGYYTEDEFHPCGGNYWDNQNGNDFFRGVAQNENGSDGICDIPFNISSGDSQDKYPLMEPWIGEPLTLTIYVDDDNTGGPWNGSCDHPYKSIQDALDKATIPRDTVFVYNGTYYEHIIIDESIDIIGQNKETTIIDGQNEQDNAVKITADWVNISGFTIQNTTYDSGFPSIYYAGIKIDNVEYNIIEGNIIKNNDYGITIRCSSNNIVTKNIIKFNNMCGVYFDTFISNPPIIENYIYHNNFYNNTQHINYAANNFYDNNYPSGGNYWDDYNGIDNYTGPGQNISGSDDIGDTPYNISEYGGQDHYPLMKPYEQPEITNISVTPSILGFGYNISITANITDNIPGNTSRIDTVKANITYPDTTKKEFTMNNTYNDTYQLIFTDTWLYGQYNYSITAIDNDTNTNTSPISYFTVSANATLTIQTIHDYYKSNETINITDPPPQNPQANTTFGNTYLPESYNITITENQDHLILTNDGITWKFSKRNETEIWHNHTKLVAAENWTLEQYDNHQWTPQGFPYNITYTQPEPYHATVTRHYQNHTGTIFSITYDFYAGARTKITFTGEINQNAHYRLIWETTGVNTDSIENNITHHHVKIWDINNTCFTFDYTDVSDILGNNNISIEIIPAPTNSTIRHIFNLGLLTPGHYTLDPTFGYTSQGTSSISTGNAIRGSWFECSNDGAATTIKAYIIHTSLGGGGGVTYGKAAIYTYQADNNATLLIANTSQTTLTTGWNTFPFTTAPTLEGGTNYFLVVWASTASLTSDYLVYTTETSKGIAKTSCTYNGTYPTNLSGEVGVNHKYSIYCVYNASPCLSNFYPSNLSDGVPKYPTFHVDINDTEGDNMTIGFYSNSSGFWQQFGEIHPGTNNTFGDTQTSTTNESVHNTIRGTWYTCPANGTATSIVVYTYPCGFDINPSYMKAALYYASNYTLLASTQQITYRSMPQNPVWETFTFSTSPTLVAGEQYYVVLWGSSGGGTPIYYRNQSDINRSIMLSESYGTWPTTLNNPTYLTDTVYDIYVKYNTTSTGNGTYYMNHLNMSDAAWTYYWNVSLSDGMNNVNSAIYQFMVGYQSKIKNIGETNISGYLLIQVQYYNETFGEWVVANDTINETAPRVITAGSEFGLDTVFNGLVNTSDLLDEFGEGTYRVYAAFRDPYGNVLVCDDETALSATWEFIIKTS
ncbi:MAG: S8 family serine peptidase [Methanobacteriota archaeon]